MVSFLSNIILVPLGYTKIFIFQKTQNEKNVGLSQRASTSRKRRNLVAAKFNLFNWILETASILLVVVSSRDFQMLYIFCISCGPPLLYFFGMEENRRAAEDYIKSNIRVFNKVGKKNVIGTEPDPCQASKEDGQYFM